MNLAHTEMLEPDANRATAEAQSLALHRKRSRPTHRLPGSRVMACAFLLRAVVWVAACPARSTAQDLIAGELNVGFSEQAFAGVNRSDAEAAFKAYPVSVGRQRGYDLVARTQVFKTTHDFEAAIRAGKLHLTIIPSWDYLAMDLQGFADPYFVAMDDAGILERYVLLTQRGSGLKSFADLRGKSVAVLESVDAYMSVKWMETVLLEERLGTPETFFGRLERVTKASGAVLPVFFGKHQACVVDRAAFDVMKELNPQVGERLQTVVVSEPLLGAVICLGKSGWVSAKHKEDTREGLIQLNDGPAGQQILTLFRVRKMAPFKPEYLDSVRKLRAIHDQFSGRVAQVRQ